MIQHIKCNCPIAVVVLRKHIAMVYPKWASDNNFKLVDINPANFIIVQLNILMNVKEWIF